MALWGEYSDKQERPYILARFQASDCRACSARALCTRATQQGRSVYLHVQPAHEALIEMRAYLATEEGRQRYARGAGVEGTISQGVRGFGLRRTRYRGLAKTHLGHVATATAINLDRLVGWLDGRPREETRTSRFMALAA